MKICGKCGHRNFNVKMKGKDRICENCDTKMDDSPQCRPELGGHENYESDGGGNGYSVRKKLLHDQEPWEV